MERWPLGSSPLARGPRGIFSPLFALAGLIPARAGTTGLPSRRPWRPRAHPRSRGDHLSSASLSVPRRGSSPLARGPLPARWPAPPARGLIPARAGTTEMYTRYPFVRGDHVESTPGRFRGSGSSPLARGPQWGFRWCGRHQGLIPARAGTTRLRCRSCRRGWAHPRSRGEHQGVNYATTTSRSSSPLARGTRFEVCHSLEVVGLIPARAGNTVARKFAGSSSRAHPRSRGEHCVWMVGVGGILGSSPLARGTLQTAGDSGHKKGLIPARAGNTVRAWPLFRHCRAHPRSRGEHGMV